MSESAKNENSFVGYEYKELTVKHSMEPVYTDSYPSFGWQLEGVSGSPQGIRFVSLKFKRNRKLRNKAEISRLQRQFEAGVSEIESLEFSKVMKASGIAYGIGLVGTAFMAGSVFAITAGNTPLCIILAVPAFIGWIVPYLLFRRVSGRKSAEVTPLIDKKYDEIYEICEKAGSLLKE
ncbi:MAG: hypothetical protein H6Q60_214 [Oscillospiraceae bacterium]|nr:hypothetical protein [Oscillospiraceae bacterium]